MSPRKFDRFMVDVNVGTNRKLRRLNPQERWCALAGVFAIAAVSPIRGALLIADGPAEAVDYAEQAGVSLPIANATLKKLRNMGVVYEADDGDFERVHDFEDWNPAPRNDPTAAERMRRYRERLARNGSRVTERNDRNVTERNGDGVTPGREEKVEEKPPPTPPRGEDEGGNGTGSVTFARRPVPPVRLALAERLLAYFNDKAGTGHGARTGRGEASESLRRIIGALTDHPNVDEQQWQAAVRWRLANPFWDGKPDTGVVFGPRVASANLASALQSSTSPELMRKLVGE